jgi:uncharacterized membrane protein YfcA
MQMQLSVVELAAVCAAVAVGATLQGSVGIGVGLVSAPVLALIEPRLVPAPLIVSGMVLALLVLCRGRQSIHLSGLKWALIGRIPGAILGGALLAVLPQDRMALAFGILVLGAVAMSVSGLCLQPTGWTLVCAGVLSGIMGTIASIGGPPLALVYQGEAGARLRGTLSAYFVISSSISLLVLRLAGRFGSDELRLALALLPGVLIGFAASTRVAPLVDRGYTRPAVLTLSALAGVVVILRQIC